MHPSAKGNNIPGASMSDKLQLVVDIHYVRRTLRVPASRRQAEEPLAKLLVLPGKSVSPTPLGVQRL